MNTKKFRVVVLMVSLGFQSHLAFASDTSCKVGNRDAVPTEGTTFWKRHNPFKSRSKSPARANKELKVPFQKESGYDPTAILETPIADAQSYVTGIIGQIKDCRDAQKQQKNCEKLYERVETLFKPIWINGTEKPHTLVIDELATREFSKGKKVFPIHLLLMHLTPTEVERLLHFYKFKAHGQNDDVKDLLEQYSKENRK